MADPRSLKEALIAELLGDVDRLVARVDSLSTAISGAAENITNTTAAMVDAGERYRQAVTTFTGEAKHELVSFLERKAAEVGKRTADEQRVVLQEIANTTFRAEAIKFEALLQAAIQEKRQPLWQRLMPVWAAVVAGTIAGLIVVVTGH